MNTTLLQRFGIVVLSSILSIYVSIPTFAYAKEEVETLSFLDTFGASLARVDLHSLLEDAFEKVQSSVVVPASFEVQDIVIVDEDPIYVTEFSEDVWIPKNDTNFEPVSSYTVSTPVITQSQNIQKPTIVQEVSSTKLSQKIKNFTISDEEKKLTAREQEEAEKLLLTLFQKFPESFTTSLENMTLKTSTEGPRGLAGASTMILRVTDISKSELVGVAIHELGHVVDLGHLKGTLTASASNFMDGSTAVPSNDPSSEFYAISWKSAKEKNGARAEDFVSGYAASDPFEDFAETFNYYVLHGDEFLSLTKGNGALGKKYTFMKDKVFGGEEFLKGSSQKKYTTYRPWDTTVLAYDWNWYLKASFE